MIVYNHFFIYNFVCLLTDLLVCFCLFVCLQTYLYTGLFIY